MTDDVLCVRYSANHKFLAIALLDTTVKIFFADSLKFYLSLYGHKLPVTSMDISSDSTLIATASSDKSVKLWGLDFGDCHKSLLAHSEAVTAVTFVNGTHYFFSASKDGLIKYWDGDTYDEIHKIEGHFGEIWALAISRLGNFLVSSSQDRSLRIWCRTDNQVSLRVTTGILQVYSDRKMGTHSYSFFVTQIFLEIETEKRMELEMDSTLVHQTNRQLEEQTVSPIRAGFFDHLIGFFYRGLSGALLPIHLDHQND
jgi:WD40 repeat protein